MTDDHYFNIYLRGCGGLVVSVYLDQSNFRALEGEKNFCNNQSPADPVPGDEEDVVRVTKVRVASNVGVRVHGGDGNGCLVVGPSSSF
ncbi:hypothetical protein ACFX2G_043307 [Malus domestica]